MPLQDKLDANKALPNSRILPEFRPVIARTISTLVASGQAEGALKAGDLAPTFTLPDPDGNPVHSAETLDKGPLVITFYRGVWCPFCNIELQALEEAAGEIRLRGASLLAISQQTAAYGRKAQRDNNLSFPILSDQGGSVGAAFGLRWVVPDEMRDVHKKLGGPLPMFNGEDSWTLPMPARYVIAPDGIIAYAEVNPDYTHRPDPSELFPTLDRLQVPIN